MRGQIVTEKGGEQLCASCGGEIKDWRKQYTDLCINCGSSRCRGCGIVVDNMEHTMEGGLCIPCAGGV